MKYIIMCGGSYPKFDTPKQLLKINGEVITERTIRLLRENGVTDIAISTNNPAFDYLDVELLHDKDNQFSYWGENEQRQSNKCWLKAYYPVNEPVCYLHGDVYWSDEAIKTIVETKVKDTMFFCTADKQDIPNKDIRCAGGREPLAYKVENYKLFRNAVDDLLNMVDEGKFSNAFCSPIAWTMYRYLNNLDLCFNAKWFGDLNDIFKSKGDYIIINDYTNDIDDIKDVKKIEDYLKFEEGKMIKVEVIGEFTLGDFDKIKNSLVRKSKAENGKLFKGDTFECDEPMVRYLSGENAYHKAYVRVIEILPEEKPVEAKIEYDTGKPLGVKIDLDDAKVIGETIKKTTRKSSKKSKK